MCEEKKEYAMPEGQIQVVKNFTKAIVNLFDSVEADANIRLNVVGCVFFTTLGEIRDTYGMDAAEEIFNTFIENCKTDIIALKENRLEEEVRP